MNITATYVATEAYSREFYAQWLERSKWKKWDVPLSALLIVFGIIYYGFNQDNYQRFVSFIMVLGGAYELFKHYSQKKQWLKARKESALFNQEMQLIFGEEKITHKGPFSEGSFRWEGLQSIIRTSGGLFLIPENGVSIYLPQAAFSSVGDIQKIQEKFKRSKTARGE